MLFDPKKAEQTELLMKPSLKGLAYLLRHKELWPEGFQWSFYNLQTCAMGLGAAFWYPDGSFYRNVRELEHALNIDSNTRHNLFYRGNWYGWNTPESVAGKIDKAIAAQEKCSFA